MYLERKGKTTDQSGDFESKQIGIKAENMDLAFQELINYSNPVGSIVREIASNCLDAHTDAGVDEPPVIRLSDSFSSSQTYVDFIDFGEGMSEEKIENIYGSLYESDKRDSNDKIGAFGIGSKAPLAYCDSYTLITVHEGTKRQYWVYNHGQGFSITKYDESPADEGERSGTKVRVPIHNTPGEIRKFENEIKKQLSFFRKIRVEGFDDIDDNHIVEGENFIVSKWSARTSRDICACLGGVRYDLREDLLRDSVKRHLSASVADIMDINIGIKLDIGDVGVTSKREDIKYTDEAIETIAEKIADCWHEIQGIIDERTSVDSLEDLLGSGMKGNRLSLTDDIQIRIPMMMNTRPTYNKYPNIDPFSAMFGISVNTKVIQKYYLRDFPTPEYTTYNINQLLSYTQEYTVYHHYHGEMLNKLNNFVIDERDRSAKPIVCVVPEPDYLDDLDNLEDITKGHLRDAVRHYSSGVVRPQLSSCPKALQEIRDFYRELRQYLIDNTTYYHSIVPTDEELNEKKRIDTFQLNTSASHDDKITIKFLTYYPRHQDSIKFKETDFSKSKRSLDREFFRTGNIIYGFRDDRDQLMKAFSMLLLKDKLVKSDDDYVELIKSKVVSVSKQNAKILRKVYPDRVMHVSEYMKGIHSTFRQAMTYLGVHHMIGSPKIVENPFFDDDLVSHVESSDTVRIKVLQTKLARFMHSFTGGNGFGDVSITANKVYERYKDFYNKHNLWYPGIFEAIEELYGFACKYPMLLNLERNRSRKPILSNYNTDVQEDDVLNDHVRQYLSIVPNKNVHPRFFKSNHEKQ